MSRSSSSSDVKCQWEDLAGELYHEADPGHSGGGCANIKTNAEW